MPDRPVAEGETNWLLSSLPPRERRRLFRHLEPIALGLGQVLYEPGQAIPYVYFPCGGLVSLLTPQGDDKAVEVGVVGREGMVGLSVLLRSDTTQYHAIVQGEGQALRLPAEALQEAVWRSRPLADLLLRYVDAFLVQVSQSAACRSLHSVVNRYCYWLLMAHDRMARDHLPFTQKFLALMLAVRLASISEAAGMLRKAGLIQYSRGGVHILDRRGLEAASCSCYQIIRERFDRLRA